ncbi:hypothetical protein ABT382_06740 [Streptomyces pharetrae]|uniref:hypothetical protein n=1 Tax=Streptomyces pharetrae TaxID=291370 RepID=UPI003363BF2B
MNSKWARSRRLLLRELHAEAHVSAYVRELGWKVHEVRRPYPGEEEYRVIWAANPQLMLHYIEDEVAERSFVFIIGADAELVSGSESVFERRLNAVTLDELIDEVDSASSLEQLSEALLRAGVGAPREFDERFFSRIINALSHPSSEVREGALWAVTYSPWSQYRERVLDISRSDPEEELREMANIVAEEFAEQERGEQ